MFLKRLIFLAIFFNFILILSLIFQNIEGVTFLSVGQGDSALISESGMNFLIDAGRDEKVVESLGNILNRRKYLDFLMITHIDKDHWGGLKNIVKQYEVGAILLPITTEEELGEIPKDLKSLLKEMTEKGSQIIFLQSSDKLIFREDSEAIILHPQPKTQFKNDNDNSLVLLYKKGNYKILFTGDISIKVEEYLASIFKDFLEANILKIAHHGSKYSSSYQFLSAVNPQIAVISVGKNSYGHPAREALERIESVSRVILRTDEVYNIFFDANNFRYFSADECRVLACNVWQKVLLYFYKSSDAKDIAELEEEI